MGALRKEVEIGSLIDATQALLHDASNYQQRGDVGNAAVSVGALLNMAYIVVCGTGDEKVKQAVRDMTINANVSGDETTESVLARLLSFYYNSSASGICAIMVAPNAKDEYVRKLLRSMPSVSLLEEYDKDAINRMIKKKTNGIIENAFQGELPQGSQVNLVVSVIDLFKGEWEKKPVMLNEEFEFTKIGTGKKLLLHTSLQFSSPFAFCVSRVFSAAAIELQGGGEGSEKKLTLFVKIYDPENNGRLGEFCTQTLNTRLCDESQKHFTVQVPPFEIRHRIDVLDMLKRKMQQQNTTIQMQNVADLSELAVLEATAKVSCTEDGVDCTGVATAVVVTRSLHVTNITMDHTFFFLTGRFSEGIFTPLFVSMVADPSSSVGRARGF